MGHFAAGKEIRMNTMRAMAVAAVIVAGALALQRTQAQQPAIGRTEVLRHDLGQPGREVVQVRVDFAPGAAFGMHTHPGEEEGKPPITLKAGESLFIPAGAIHAARNVGSGNAAELATYLVEKGKPIVEAVR
jgi:quercetin dioxygenase-like cupin family protein